MSPLFRGKQSLRLCVGRVSRDESHVISDRLLVSVFRGTVEAPPLQLIRQHRLGRRKHFTIAGILAIVIPAILGILVAIDWERFFVTFHKLAFRNDFWLFDPATDPVILILPDTYFLQCAVGILAIILIGAVVFLLLGRRRK